MPEANGLIRPEAQVNLDMPTEASFLTISTPGPILLGPAQSKQDWQVCSLPPPFDLVTILQRLTI